MLKVRQSRKQILVSSILPKKNVEIISCNEDYPNVRFFGRNEDTVNCFRDLLTFNITKENINANFVSIAIHIKYLIASLFN